MQYPSSRLRSSSLSSQLNPSPDPAPVAFPQDIFHPDYLQPDSCCRQDHFETLGSAFRRCWGCSSDAAQPAVPMAMHQLPLMRSQLQQWLDPCRHSLHPSPLPRWPRQPLLSLLLKALNKYLQSTLTATGDNCICFTDELENVEQWDLPQEPDGWTGGLGSLWRTRASPWRGRWELHCSEPLCPTPICAGLRGAEP